MRKAKSFQNALKYGKNHFVNAVFRTVKIGILEKFGYINVTPLDFLRTALNHPLFISILLFFKSQFLLLSMVRNT